ncbi:MAG: hypothetical protein LKF71_04875 [Oscillospiraceae bacterium]|jgi:hypothetical protein|nr:hypothetical protein [Oscillospiraceae bacterium]
MRIPYPSEQTERRQIAEIVQKGMAQRPSLLLMFRQMRQSMGIRVIFHDMADTVFISTFTTLCIFSSMLHYLKDINQSHNDLYAMLFTFSPMLYLLLCLLGLWKERISHTFDLKMTCRYTPYDMMAFRMLIFSCISIFVNMVAVGIFCAQGATAHFWHLFFVTASGLFLFSALLLFSVLHNHGLLAPTATALGWLLANGLVYQELNTGYSNLLQAIPLYLHIVVTILCACVYFAGLSRLFQKKEECEMQC